MMFTKKSFSPGQRIWWTQFVVIASLALLTETKIATELGSTGRIRMNFNTSGSGPIASWDLPYPNVGYQHRLLGDNFVENSGRYTYTIAKDGSFSQLEISDVSFEDSGTYTCNMIFSNEGQASKQSSELAIIGVPIILMNGNKTENDTATAKCCVSTSWNVNDQLKWSLSEEKLHPQSRYDSTKPLEDVAFNSICSEIKFKVYRRYNQLSLDCSMVAHSSFSASIVMNVHYPATIKYAKNYAKRHTHGRISCISGGNPRPSVELQSFTSEKHWEAFPNVIEYSNVNGTLTYWDFEININANVQLRCLAVNEIPPPATTNNLFLEAKHPPKVTIFSDSITAKDGRDVSVYCQVSGYPPAATIALSSFDKYMDSKGDIPIYHPVKSKWNDSNTVTWQFELKDLKTAQSRKYRCVANTSVGLAYSETIYIDVYDEKVNTQSILIYLSIMSSAIVVIIMTVLITWKISKRQQDSVIINDNLPKQGRENVNHVPIRNTPGRQSHQRNEESYFTSSDESETVSVDDYANIVFKGEAKLSSSTPDFYLSDDRESSYMYHVYGKDSNSDRVPAFYSSDDVNYAKTFHSQLHSILLQSPNIPQYIHNEENNVSYI